MKARLAAFVLILSSVGAATAGDDMPIRIDIRFKLRFGPTAVTPQYMAPWYLWWPANANETMTTHDFQTSPYPTWPTNQPYVSGGGAQTGPVAHYGQTPPFQPVSYAPTQVPSYWYGR